MTVHNSSPARRAAEIRNDLVERPDGPVDVDGLASGDMAPGLPLGHFLPYLLNRIVNRLNRDLADDLKALGTPLQFYRVLAVLASGNASTVNDLAVYTVTEQSTLSRILFRMEEDGLIERQSDEADGRLVTIVMTEAGEAAYGDLLPIALRHYEQAFSVLSPDEHRQVLGAMRKVLENVRQSPLP
ncbi:MAG: MarR family winged helix-turn-helix transcriptional regulator [Pseudomonadota bacterium]